MKMKAKNQFIHFMLLLLLVFSCRPVQATESMDQNNDDENLTLENRVKECKGHFDITSYVQWAFSIGFELEEEEFNEIFSEDTKKSVQHLINKGQLKLSPSQQKDLKAISCAAFAEGMILYSLNFVLTKTLVEEMKEFFGNGTVD